MTEIFGVLNVTPDSFSDGGRYLDHEVAARRGLELASQGATVIDVGGESTRPGAVPVGASDEIARVIPVIEALVAAGLTVSVDTIHAATAAAAVAAGARYINDVSGGLNDPEMLAVAAGASRDHGAKFIIGHWRGIPDAGHGRSEYRDVVAEVVDAISGLVDAALEAGVAAEHVVVDPGLGFDKTDAQGWQLLAELPRLSALGYPVLVGASRKRMLGATVDGLAPVAGEHPRDLATAVVSALSLGVGAWGVRVHDVPGTAQALAVAAAWQRAGSAAGSAAGAELDAPAPADPAAAGSGSKRASRDRITLTGLEVFAHHGVFDFERENGQKFLIDAEVLVDLAPAAEGDALASTVHYGELAEAIDAAVRRDPVDLIETVATRVADVALSFAGVREARITVHKPDAPIDLPFADVSVTVVREAAA